MEILRTANAGVLLKLDGTSVLIDGVCQEIKPYLATPPQLRAELQKPWPDAVAFTHTHKDHYDPDYAAEFSECTDGVIFGSKQLHISKAISEAARVGNVTVCPIKSRHIGVIGRTVEHYSFLIKGSKTVFFAGDAAPLQWRQMTLPEIDVAIVPYAYALTPAAWQATKELGASQIILVHMPLPEEDPLGLWDGVNAVLGAEKTTAVHIPVMGECLEI